MRIRTDTAWSSSMAPGQRDERMTCRSPAPLTAREGTVQRLRLGGLYQSAPSASQLAILLTKATRSEANRSGSSQCVPWPAPA